VGSHLLPPPLPYHNHHLPPPPLPVHPPPGISGGVGGVGMLGNDDGCHLIPQAKVVGSELAVASSLGMGGSTSIGNGGMAGNDMGTATLAATAGSAQMEATTGIATDGGVAVTENGNGTTPTKKKKKKKRKKKKLLKGGLTLAYDPEEEEEYDDDDDDEEEVDGKKEQRGGDCCMEERRARLGKYQSFFTSGSKMAYGSALA